MFRKIPYACLIAHTARPVFFRVPRLEKQRPLQSVVASAYPSVYIRYAFSPARSYEFYVREETM